MITLNGNSRFISSALATGSARPTLTKCVGVQFVNGKTMLGATDGRRLHMIPTDLDVGTYRIHVIKTSEDAILTPDTDNRFPDFAAVVPQATARTRLHLPDFAQIAQTHAKALLNFNLCAVLTAHNGTLKFLGYMDLSLIDPDHPRLIGVDPTFLAHALTSLTAPIYASLDRDNPSTRPLMLYDDTGRVAVIMPRVLDTKDRRSDDKFRIVWNL